MTNAQLLIGIAGALHSRMRVVFSLFVLAALGCGATDEPAPAFERADGVLEMPLAEPARTVALWFASSL